MAADPTDDPIDRFKQAFARASETESFDPARAALATVDRGGHPDVRFVLVKHAGPEGFAFFTNYESPKARHLEASPSAALAFHWASLSLQVRVRGSAQMADEAVSDAYFASRPRGSQLAAWASRQSAPIETRAALEARFAQMETRFAAHASVPRPPFWGGFLLVPAVIEFWTSRENRMHERLLYTRDECSSGWRRELLQP